MFFDPVYLLVIFAGMALSGWAALVTKGNFKKFGKVTTEAGMTGEDVARKILAAHRITDVQVEPVPGSLTDHYDPRTRTLRLSEPVFSGKSISAVGVAAHEVGHAIQDAEEYAPLKFRSAWVPVASVGNGISIVVLILAAVLGGIATPQGTVLAWLGIALFGTATIFTLVTLPVEFDASNRALATLDAGRYLTEDEMVGARKVLNAAAMTYVAAFITSLLTLLYWAYRLGLVGGRRS